MDDIVKQAMAKWPHVPDCYGWLGLDARGDWYMRDDRVQALGDFKHSKGSRLQHHKLIEFIGRNYACDTKGQWFFQNGPQRVYVELEVTPWIWRIQTDGALQSHTRESAHIEDCYVDEEGRVYLQTDIGFGLLHTQDVWMAAQFVEQDLWRPQEVLSQTLAQRFGFNTSPKGAQKAPNA
jgi:hypothetical protein